jgi:hypothetical protein
VTGVQTCALPIYQPAHAGDQYALQFAHNFVFLDYVLLALYRPTWMGNRLERTRETIGRGGALGTVSAQYRLAPDDPNYNVLATIRLRRSP